MRRRDFIKGVANSAAAWPLAARAQQPAMPVIGFLRSTSLGVSTPMITGFRQGLTATGFTEGQNVVIEYRYADDQLERLSGLVAELIRLPVAVIVVNGSAAAFDDRRECAVELACCHSCRLSVARICRSRRPNELWRQHR
jgi:putative tryptophan/tyrosine transport system substrate-binding protein